MQGQQTALMESLQAPHPPLSHVCFCKMCFLSGGPKQSLQRSMVKICLLNFGAQFAHKRLLRPRSRRKCGHSPLAFACILVQHETMHQYGFRRPRYSSTEFRVRTAAAFVTASVAACHPLLKNDLCLIFGYTMVVGTLTSQCMSL